MFFRILLMVLGRRLEWLSENQPAFREAIRARRCVLQFRTRDNRVAHHVIFSAGKVRSGTGLHESPSLQLVFESAASARNLVLSMARDPSDRAGFMRAINQGTLRIEGDIGLLIWFMMVSDFLVPQALSKVPLALSK